MSKWGLRSAALIFSLFVMVLVFQNCGTGFNSNPPQIYSGLHDSSSLTGGTISTLVPNGPSIVLTANPIVTTATTSTSITFIFNVNQGTSQITAVRCTLDSGAPADCMSPQSFNNLGVGSHKFIVSATDANGLVGSVQISWSIVSIPTPTPTPGPTPFVLQNQWSPMNPVSAPDQRSNSAGVWTGTKMIVFGGSRLIAGGGVQVYGDGGVFDPTTNTWQTMNSAGAPSSRASAVSVWTGTKMLVFSGFGAGGSTLLNDGGIYDPATNTWQTLSSFGAPSARGNASAVWTGSRMIVFGGSNTNTGGSYDPVTDTWQAISTVGAPSARSTRAIWTGTKMIVFGGSSSVGATLTFFNDGGLYDPATNTWQALSTVGAPSPRAGHSLIWTGSKMIVFGGTNYDGSVKPVYNFNDGGIYDPATNTWQSLNTVGAPSPRDSHSAIWNGTQMIVFGGFSYSSSMTNYESHRTGGRFDPVTNTWQSLQAVGAPTARNGHLSFWTGTRMLIFGGVNEQAGVGARTYPMDGAYYY